MVQYNTNPNGPKDMAVLVQKADELPSAHTDYTAI